MITIKTFAQIREISGRAELTIKWQADMTVDNLMKQLALQDAAWANALTGNVLVAVNKTMCNGQQRLNDNDEVAFFPPVTGG